MLLPLILGCGATQLSQSWQIDRLRVLAVAAEPAEPRPGDVVSFTSLTVSPAVPVAMTTWFVCVFEDAAGCAIDPSVTEDLEGLDPSELSAEELAALYAELQAAGLIGVEPFLPPTWVVPADTLDALDATARLEGVTATVSVTAIPDQEVVDEGDLELAFKRVPVSEATTPNRNPGPVGLTVDGLAFPAGTRVALERGQTYTLAVSLPDDAIEDYTYVTQDGVSETRTEEPYFTWYLQEGSFDETDTLYPYVEVQYTTPASPTLEEQSVWVVVRDRRGGMAWTELPIRLR